MTGIIVGAGLCCGIMSVHYSTQKNWFPIKKNIRVVPVDNTDRLRLIQEPDGAIATTFENPTLNDEWQENTILYINTDME